jgi:cardiolipin synthase A/B
MLLDEAAIRGRAIDRAMAERVLARVAGSELTEGNEVRLLRDGAENYPAWLDAIASAERTVHVETYYIRDDATGRAFVDALAAKARQGVAVRVLYDWLGALGKASPSLWRQLAEAGAQVRAFNPPRLDGPLAILSRNHRKFLGIDGRIGFVAGLCIGDDWVGGPAVPWRDTGIELRGPAVPKLEAAFARSWTNAGGAALPEPPFRSGEGAAAGRTAVRVIESQPNTLGLYRFDQLIVAAAYRSLWLTDAYFVGTTGYVQALCEAARDGVDVRLLVPSSTDIPVIKKLSRAGYRPLLEAGVRVFEWNGPMLHAKTAVADGRWARVGSSNLNLASWIGNWELDVAIEDEAFAGEMETMYVEDLANATEIVLDVDRVHVAADRAAPADRPAEQRHPGRHRAGRAAAGALGFGSAVGAAITNRRALGPAEARVLAAGGALLLVLAVLGAVFPRLFMVPLALLGAWVGSALLIRAWKLRVASRSAKKLPHRLRF